MPDVLTVSALNRYVKRILDANDVLFDLALQGEIANFVKNARSGHCYFSLRDANASVKAVMFKSDAQKLGFLPEEGMKVVVRCRVTLYERDGAFQIYVTDIFPAGVGAAQLAFDQLKAKLEAEGLFDRARKKEIPYQPSSIGLVTSKTGAALQDILNVTARRWPMVKLILCPVSVQGFEAASQIANAITMLDQSAGVDTIIVARGGGSKEDLWVFNAEIIARAAANCNTPLISAIGHEIDFTILDFVSDLRAPTPSAAAELAVPDITEVYQKIYNLQNNIQNFMQMKCNLCYNNLMQQSAQYHDGSAAAKVAVATDTVALLQENIFAKVHRLKDDKTNALQHAAALAASFSPYNTLARGYALVKIENNQVATVDQLAAGQTIQLVGQHKTAECIVQSTKENHDEKTEKF
ncbi:MAG: exodeoxyribonuclease VII large subunit [Faecalibacterium sp.]